MESALRRQFEIWVVRRIRQSNESERDNLQVNDILSLVHIEIPRRRQGDRLREGFTPFHFQLPPKQIIRKLPSRNQVEV
jgi:hypothetical protein